jgi:hypothetical protein
VVGDERDHPADKYRYRRVDQRNDKADDEKGYDQTTRLTRIMPIKGAEPCGRRALRRQRRRL